MVVEDKLQTDRHTVELMMPPRHDKIRHVSLDIKDNETVFDVCTKYFQGILVHKIGYLWYLFLNTGFDKSLTGHLNMNLNITQLQLTRLFQPDIVKIQNVTVNWKCLKKMPITIPNKAF